MLVDEQGARSSPSGRDPVAVEMYREQGYLPAAFRNYLALLGWSPGDDEKVPLETLIEKLPPGGRAAIARLLRCAEADAHERRLHPGAPTSEFVEASRPWVHPVPGQWAPADGTIPTAEPPSPRPPWPAERFDPERFARMAPVVQERVATLSEVPAMVDFVFLEDPPSTRTAGRRPSVATTRWRSDPAGGGGRLRHV